MTEELLSEHNEKELRFLEQFEEAAKAPYDPEILRTKRLKAWDHFLEIGLPGNRAEDFMYMSLDPILHQSREPCAPEELAKEQLIQHILPESTGSCLVFINGAFRRELSFTSAISDVVVLPMTMAIRSYTALLQSFWAKTVKEESDPFAALNAACHQEGLFIYIPPGKKITPHLQVLYMHDAEGCCWTMPKLHVVVGRSSEAVLVETHLFSKASTASLNNSVLDIQLEENAELQHAMSYVGTGPILLGAIRAFLKRDSRLTSCAVLAAPLVRRSLKVQLIGSGAKAELVGVSMLANADQTHMHVLVDHQEPSGESTQLFKSIVDDKAHASFEGKILVRQKAQKTQAYQLNNNLLLSSQAQANSKPNLEIFADDVKASHGATSGRLDEEQLLYLRTRGLNKMVAEACLIQGFCEEVVQKVANPTLRRKLHELVLQLYTGAVE